MRTVFRFCCGVRSAGRLGFVFGSKAVARATHLGAKYGCGDSMRYASEVRARVPNKGLAIGFLKRLAKHPSCKRLFFVSTLRMNPQIQLFPGPAQWPFGLSWDFPVLGPPQWSFTGEAPLSGYFWQCQVPVLKHAEALCVQRGPPAPPFSCGNRCDLHGQLFRTHTLSTRRHTSYISPHPQEFAML